MLLNIKVTPRASKNEVIKLDNENYRVRLTAAPVDGKANIALIKLLSDYFNVAKNRISIVKGDRGKIKLIKIID